MSWIRGMLAGLLSAMEALVIAIHQNDQVNVVNLMRCISDMQKHIEAEWVEMVGALERAEQTLRNLGDGDLTGDAKTITLHEAENIRVVLDKQRGDDGSRKA